jgi:hypothetical protein
MPRVQLEIGTGFYESASLPLSAQRCINLYPVIPQATALNQRALFGCPGTKTHPTSGATIVGSNRGSQVMKGVGYFINGSRLYSVTTAGVIVDLGTITGSGRISLANNGQFLVIVVPGGDSFAFDNVANTLAQITDIDFISSSTVVFKDGFFVFSAADGSVFFNSALNDPFSYDALDFGTAEINPDRIVALHVNHNELFVGGEETIELFQNVGGSGFPFQRIPGANIQKGVYGRFTLAEFDNTFVFVGGGRNEEAAVWKVTGSSSVQKISTSAIDNAIQKFSEAEISDAFSWTYSEGGNFFVGFTFTSGRIPSKTFVYDATTSALAGSSTWHERQTGVTDNRWRVNSMIRLGGKLLVGDQIDGRIGELDLETSDEFGDVLFWSKSTSPFSNQGQRSFFGEIELFMQAGEGLTTGQGSDPVVRMDFSDDGGRTFSSEFSRNYGKIGVFNKRTIWRRQGDIPNQRVLRFSGSDPVKRNILKLEANAEGGTQ